MAQKMPRRLVALSASAIAAVYFAGYLATQGADSRLAASEMATPTLSVVLPPTPATRSSGQVATTDPPLAAAGSAATAGYRDGTYQGQGTSRRGGVAVAVTIQGGRITNLAFTQVTTQYPVSRIAALPAEVVARQSAQVDRVTGATFSVQAFQQAVQQALASASVVAPTALAADGLATAAFVLGPKRGLRLLEREGVEGLLIAPSGEIRRTAGLTE